MAKREVVCVSLDRSKDYTYVFFHRSPKYCRLYYNPTKTSLWRLSNLLQTIHRGYARGQHTGFVRINPFGWAWYNYNVEEHRR